MGDGSFEKYLAKEVIFDDMYRLDKNVSKITTLNEASSNYGYWKNKSITERLAAGIYLIKTAYRLTEFPKMDKTIHSIRRLSS